MEAALATPTISGAWQSARPNVRTQVGQLESAGQSIALLVLDLFNVSLLLHLS